LLILLFAAVALLSGLDAALLRLGVTAPVRSESLAGVHGVLMIYGFLGTAIALERAVALQAGGGRATLWAYAAPIASGLGAIILVAQAAGAPLPAGTALPGGAFVLGMVLFLAIYVALSRRQMSYAIGVQLLAGVAGLVGAVLWARGGEPATIVPWWAGLLILTIVGERLELARVAFLGHATEPRILVESALLLVGAVLTMVAPAVGYTLLGLVLAVLMVDTLLHYVARKTIHAPHRLTRLMAACMLAGYVWALVAALTWLIGGPALSGYRYDIVLHSLTIGYALSMVLAHAPVIVPAIARRPLPYHPLMWAVALLLHLGLAIRVIAGVRGAAVAWEFGGSLSVTALLAFLVTTVVLVATSVHRFQGGRTSPTAASSRMVEPGESPTLSAEKTSVDQADKSAALVSESPVEPDSEPGESVVLSGAAVRSDRDSVRAPESDSVPGIDGLRAGSDPQDAGPVAAAAKVMALPPEDLVTRQSTSEGGQ
jgi:nitrite reductase (NO-forming)